MTTEKLQMQTQTHIEVMSSNVLFCLISSMKSLKHKETLAAGSFGLMLFC